MNYYLVNYIILIDKNVTKNENIAIALHSFGGIDDFKKTIALLSKPNYSFDSIVIKSYNQVSKEIFTGSFLPDIK